MRLSFRFRAEARIIVHAWVNDEGSKRACDMNIDACVVFKDMLDRGNPPDDWNAAARESRKK